MLCQLMKVSTDWGSMFACASIDVPDWLSIWSFTNSFIVAAMSASRILLSAAVRFVLVVVRLLIVCSSAFWYAPSFARCEDIVLIAQSIIPIEREADSREDISTPERLSALHELSPS